MRRLAPPAVAALVFVVFGLAGCVSAPAPGATVWPIATPEPPTVGRASPSPQANGTPASPPPAPLPTAAGQPAAPVDPALCQVGGAISECGRVTGVVLSVDGPSIAEVESFTLRTAEGEVLDFAVERLELSGGGGDGPHLREHQRSADPVEVEFKVEDGRLVALRYLDAES